MHPLAEAQAVALLLENPTGYVHVYCDGSSRWATTPPDPTSYWDMGDVPEPVVCHVREAHDEALALLIAEGAAAVGAVIHCFTGNAAEAAAYVAAGFYISISGIVTFKGKSADPIREAAATVPADRLLLETDAPYLAPVPLRGKRNEPSYLPHTAAFVAGLRGLGAADLATQAAENTRRFFHLTAW